MMHITSKVSSKLVLITLSFLGINAGLMGQSISAGLDFTMMVCENEAVSTCGNNTNGQLGNGANVTSYTPVVVGFNLTDVIAVSAGGEHSLALKSDGTLKAWGRNSFGELGTNGSDYIEENPLNVIGLTNVISISAGYNASIALTADGNIWTWGINDYGQLGQGNNLDLAVPTMVSGMSNVRQISMQAQHTLILKSDSTVWSTGRNNNGQLGHGNIVSTNTFAQVVGLDSVKIVAISANRFHSLILTNDGYVLSFGYNSSGQLGSGNTIVSAIPDTVIELQDVIQISEGSDFSMALKSDSTVWMWGRNNSGQLGNGETTTSPNTVPTQVIGLSQVVEISAGDRHCIAKKADGSNWVWGSAASGTLGSGNSTNSLVPIEITPFCGSITSLEETSESNFSIFPNPTSGIVNIRVNDLQIEGQIFIYNMLGQEVLNSAMSSNYSSLDLSYLPKGVYYTIFQLNGSFLQKKLVLN
ncbi:MAG: T9SS type A sorting domain-containing protein [Bacteroidia bacterium]